MFRLIICTVNAIVLFFVLIMFVGCASKEEVAAKRELNNKLNKEVLILQSSIKRYKENSKILCNNKKSCDKAFALTKIYVQNNSNMRIQFSDDTMITTFNPTEVGYVSMRATKVPDAGESSVINLDVNCQGLDWAFMKSEYSYMENFGRNCFFKCASRVESIYKNFKPYVESKLK